MSHNLVSPSQLEWLCHQVPWDQQKQELEASLPCPMEEAAWQFASSYHHLLPHISDWGCWRMQKPQMSQQTSISNASNQCCPHSLHKSSIADMHIVIYAALKMAQSINFTSVFSWGARSAVLHFHQIQKGSHVDCPTSNETNCRCADHQCTESGFR